MQVLFPQDINHRYLLGCWGMSLAVIQIVRITILLLQVEEGSIDNINI
jgi:hypothetical protein